MFVGPWPHLRHESSLGLEPISICVGYLFIESLSHLVLVILFRVYFVFNCHLSLNVILCVVSYFRSMLIFFFD